MTAPTAAETGPVGYRSEDTETSARCEPKAALRSALVLPVMFLVAWGYAISGSRAPGAVLGETTAVSDLRWLLFFAGVVFIFSSVMHSVFAKRTAASIGWQTNGFEREIAFVSLGLGAASLYAVYQNMEAMVTICIPIVAFLFLAGVNHVIEIVRRRNYAPNNTLILVWDFGISLSLVVLLIVIGQF